MTFTSLNFLLFLSAVCLFFFLSPNKYKRLTLLFASYLFCAFYSAKACLTLFVVSLLDYVGGLLIFKAKDNEVKQRNILYIFVMSNILVLIVFKHLGFLIENINLFLQSVKTGQISVIHILAPAGISYYVVQGIAYLVDIYWGKIENEKHFSSFLLFMSFFPKFMMGPIERASDLLPQIKKLQDYELDYNNTKAGCILFFCGVFQKVVIADRLAVIVNSVYGNLPEQNGVSLFIATISFTIQLYYDFFGYTNMALGVGQIFGIRLTQNFNHPFSVINIQEFWRCWHISFTAWIRDYIFIPLRMSFRSLKKLGMVFSLLITFLLASFWHDIMWTYVIFYFLHGIYLIISVSTMRRRNNFWKEKGQLDKKWLKSMRISITFLMVCFSMIFFRASSISDAFYIVSHLFVGWEIVLDLSRIHSFFNFGLSKYELIIAVSSIGLMYIIYLLQKRINFKHIISEAPIYVRWSLYYAIILGIIMFGKFKGQQFIYFKF